MNKISNRRLQILGAVVFVVALAFALLFLQNLPINFGDDINNIRFSAQASWPSVIENLVNPLTPAWYVHSQENLLTTKVFEAFLLKLVYSLFALNAGVYFGLKALTFAITALLITLMVYRIGGSLLAAAGAAVFFITTPPTYRSVSLLTDFEIISQCLICVTLFVFFTLYFGKKRSTKSFILLVICMTLSLWAGTRTRETARVLPLLILAFLVIDQRFNLFKWTKKSWRNVTLVAFVVFSLILIIPLKQPSVEFDKESHQALGEFHLKNVYKVVFCNPQGADPEEKSAFFSREAKIPTSLARTFGFYLDWIFVLSIAVVIVGFFVKRKEKQQPEWSRAYPLLFVWTAATCLCFGLGFTNVFLKQRYLLTAIVPLTILVFTTFSFAGRLFPKPLRWAYAGILIYVTVLLVQINFDHIIFLRNYFGGADVAEHRAVDAAYEFIHKRKPTSDNARFDFFQREYCKYRIKDWDTPVTADYVNAFAENKPFLFIESYDTKDYRPLVGVTLIARCSTVNKSFYSWALGHFKTKIGRTLYLYGKAES